MARSGGRSTRVRPVDSEPEDELEDLESGYLEGEAPKAYAPPTPAHGRGVAAIAGPESRAGVGMEEEGLPGGMRARPGHGWGGAPAPDAWREAVGAPAASQEEVVRALNRWLPEVRRVLAESGRAWEEHGRLTREMKTAYNYGISQLYETVGEFVRIRDYLPAATNEALALQQALVGLGKRLGELDGKAAGLETRLAAGMERRLAGFTRRLLVVVVVVLLAALAVGVVVGYLGAHGGIAR